MAVYSICDRLSDYLAFVYTYFIVFLDRLTDNGNKIKYIKFGKCFWSRVYTVDAAFGAKGEDV